MSSHISNVRPKPDKVLTLIADYATKFEVKGKEVLVHFGRNGTNGQSSTKSFADAAAAQKHADKLIVEKTGKGYVAVG